MTSLATLTTNVPNAMLTAMRTLLHDGGAGAFLHLFSGPVPATAEEAIDGTSALVVKLTKDGDGSTGLTFDPTVANGVLRKTAAEVWKGTVGAGAGGEATFFRLCIGTDNGEGVAGGSDYRVQGTVGKDMTYAMFLTNNVFADAEDLELDDFQIHQPSSAV